MLPSQGERTAWPRPTSLGTEGAVPRRLHAYTNAIIIVGIAATVWSLWSLLTKPTNWLGLLLFVLVAALAELTGTDLLPGSPATVSFSSAIYFASLLVFGPFGATLTAVSSGLAATLVTIIRTEGPTRTPVIQRALFNMSVYGLSCLAGGVVYRVTGGTVGDMSSARILLPAILASITLDTLNALLIVLTVSLQTAQSAFSVWLQNFAWAAPINIVAIAVGGGALAFGYARLGMLGLGIFLLPILTTSISFQRYVGRTQDQMRRLEDIIAERTAQLRAANEELTRLDQHKTQFYSIINHEMRTPLTSVMGYCDLLRASGGLTDRQLGHVQVLKSNAQRLLDLVNNLLDISRIEAGRMTVSQEPADLSESIADALSVVQPLAAQKRLDIRLDLPSDLPPAHADKKRLSQVLINLLSNAIKYTPEGGQVTVRSALDQDGSMLLTSVADTGIGIPLDRLPRIFDRFSREESEQTRGTVGTGLGLTITKGLVEAHGGRIWVQSQEGAGSTFFFTLPAYRTDR